MDSAEIIIGTAVVGGILGCAALPIIGFGSAGVAAGSVAAAWQSSIGNVAAGSIFAGLQSMGATGTGALVFGGIGSTATAAVPLMYRFAGYYLRSPASKL